MDILRKIPPQTKYEAIQLLLVYAKNASASLASAILLVEASGDDALKDIFREVLPSPETKVNKPGFWRWY